MTISFKSITLIALSAIALSSCSIKFKARNMPSNLKDYTAYSNGDTVFTDGTKTTAKVPTTAKPVQPSQKNKPQIPVAPKATEIKSGKSFKFLANNRTYTGLYYGRLNVVGAVEGQWVSNDGHREDSWTYYLQKRGTSTIQPYTSSNLINAVSDNKKALASARATKIYSALTVPSALVFIVGLTSSIFLEEGPLKELSASAGLIAMPVFFISMPLAKVKFQKTIKIYNRK